MSETCRSCGKSRIGHHTLDYVAVENGKLSPKYLCHPDPVDDPTLRLILGLQRDSKESKAKLEAAKAESARQLGELKVQHQADVAALKLKHEATLSEHVQRAARAAHDDVSSKIEELETAVESSQALIKELQEQVSAADAEHVRIRGALKTAEAAKDLAERQLTELSKAHSQLIASHEELNDGLQALARASAAKAQATEPKPIPAPVPVAPAPARTAPPSPPPPAQKPPAQIVDTDDEGENDFDPDEDDDQEDEGVADFSDDTHDQGGDDGEAHGDENEPEGYACACGKEVTCFLPYEKKDGTQGWIYACAPGAHGKSYLDHLKKDSKSAPQDKGELAKLFRPLP